MKNEEVLSEFMKFAYECNKVRDIKEAFEEYPVEEEWHKGKVDTTKIEEYTTAIAEALKENLKLS